MTSSILIAYGQTKPTWNRQDELRVVTQNPGTIKRDTAELLPRVVQRFSSVHRRLHRYCVSNQQTFEEGNGGYIPAQRQALRCVQDPYQQGLFTTRAGTSEGRPSILVIMRLQRLWSPMCGLPTPPEWKTEADFLLVPISSTGRRKLLRIWAGMPRSRVCLVDIEVVPHVRTFHRVRGPRRTPLVSNDTWPKRTTHPVDTASFLVWLRSLI